MRVLRRLIQLRSAVCVQFDNNQRVTRAFKRWTGTLDSSGDSGGACVTKHEVQQSNVLSAMNDVSNAQSDRDHQSIAM